VVLAACETSDCGWVIETAWWYEDKQVWMLTGGDEESQLDFTLWRDLPNEPNEPNE